KLSADQPDVKWDHNASDDIIEKVKAKLAQHYIKAVNYGVVGIPKDEAQARKVFEFAKKLGLYGITTESVESIDTIEKLVNEYDKPEAHDLPYGAGVSEVPAILNELKRQHFQGNISIEYEHNWEHSVPEVAQCIGFVRGYEAANK